VQKACVQNVLDSIVPALLADKNRKFIFAEQAINTFLSFNASFNWLLKKTKN
jgi:hypothetical protein